MRVSRFFITFAAMEKKELRAYIRKVKQRQQQDMLARQSALLCDRLLRHPRIVAAATVLLYWPLPDEVDTWALIRSLCAQGKRVLLPKVISDTAMTLHPYDGDGAMAIGPFGILEPCTPPIALAELQAITLPDDGNGKGNKAVAIVPGMAFDRQGHRLGRGKGYYDRLLQQLPHLYTIGLCFSFQLVDGVPAEATDIAMDEVVC